MENPLESLYDMTIGQFNVSYDSVILITLKQLIDDYRSTVYSLEDFFDRRKSTCLTRFNYDPFTGKEIPWKFLREEIKKSR